ncbi:hypothetical protein NIES4102_21040 [Chondrocystis sp. NIES-4102]|nr:hypothetical protein NIES4102_21040 [Chondrocystis sp. NIES-4102]
MCILGEIAQSNTKPHWHISGFCYQAKLVLSLNVTQIQSEENKLSEGINCLTFIINLAIFQRFLILKISSLIIIKISL